MSETKNRMYEGLFLFPQSAAVNLQAAADHVMELLARADAEVVTFKKWDERRLAYEIKGNKRGVYFLSYFKADPQKLTGLERDCNLSENILRAMVTRAELIPAEVIEAAEGREQLADEIKFRGEKDKERAKTSSVGTSSVTSGAAPAAAPAAPAAAPAAPEAAPAAPAAAPESE